MMMSIDILYTCRYYARIYITFRFLDSTGFSITINTNKNSVNNLHQYFETVTLQKPSCQSKLLQKGISPFN